VSPTGRVPFIILNGEFITDSVAPERLVTVIGFGAAFILWALPMGVLSFFLKDPATSLENRDGALSVACVHRFSEDAVKLDMNPPPTVAVQWHANPILFTPGGPDGGRGIWHLELQIPGRSPIKLGESQSKAELDEAVRRITDWVLAGGAADRGETADGVVRPPRGDDMPSSPPVMAVGLALVLIVTGLLSLLWGGMQYVAQQGCSPEPVDVDLARLEAGEAPPSFHVRLGEHMAVYERTLFSCRGVGEPTETTRLEWAKYPVLARSNPFFRDLAAKARSYGSVKDVPPDEWPPIENFAVLVMNRKWRRVGDIPDGMQKFDAVEGLVVNRVAPLTSSQQDLIRQHFPEVDPSKLWIVEAGRRPYAPSTCYGLMGFGTLALLGAAVVAVRARRRR